MDDSQAGESKGDKLVQKLHSKGNKAAKMFNRHHLLFPDRWRSWRESSPLWLPVGSMQCKPRKLACCSVSCPGGQLRGAQERDLKAALSGTHPSIPLVFVSGNHDLGNTPTPGTVEDYCKAWGDDYFSFWVRNLYVFINFYVLLHRLS